VKEGKSKKAKVKTMKNSAPLIIRRRTRAALSSFFTFAFLLLPFAFQGCAVDERHAVPEGAQSAVERVTEDIEQGRDAKVYEEAAEEWRASVSAEDNARMLSRVRERLGRVENRALHTGKEQQSASPPLSGHTLELLYQTRFERGSAMERFTLVEREGRWLLAGYKVTSDALR
jgi:hypothetical protein